MTGQTVTLNKRVPDVTQDYLAARLDGARDLYLLALALGVRGEGSGVFGRMIREARIHFAGVIEACKIAGLDTSDIASMLSSKELGDSIRPELWEGIEEIIRSRTGKHA